MTQQNQSEARRAVWEKIIAKLTAEYNAEVAGIFPARTARYEFGVLIGWCRAQRDRETQHPDEPALLDHLALPLDELVDQESAQAVADWLRVHDSLRVIVKES